MSFSEKILIAVCVVLFAAAVIAAVYVFKMKRDAQRLSDSVDGFVSSGKKTPVSLSDGSFSHLQNSVRGLEERLEVEKRNRTSEEKRNADFIADVSHQLKTPLAGMRLYCELRNAEAPDDYSEKELKLIERMEQLIFKLLRLEKLVSDAYVMNFEDMEIYEIAGDIVSEFRSLYPEKQYTIVGNGVLRCDRAWMREALGNLVKNSSEHTEPDGNIFIRIEKSEKTVEITVEDDGGGVREEDIIKLFSRFYRNADSPPDSTGLGLAITKAITEKHHGAVYAQNGEKGLKVIMVFPHIEGNMKI